MGSLLEKQESISAQFPMPTTVYGGVRTQTVSGETVQFIVASTNVNDAGSAAGTVVYANLANQGILNSSKDRVGNNNDTSFAFVTGTALTTQIGFDWAQFELDMSNGVSRANRMAAIGAKLSNGQFMLDHRTGLLIGKKATTGASDTAGYAYKIPAASSGGGATQPTVDSYSSVAINLTTAADQVLVAAPGANKQIWCYGFAFSAGTADGQIVAFQDEDNVAATGNMLVSQYGGFAIAPSGNFAMPIFKVATNKALEIDITGGDVDGILYYAIVSV